MRLRAFTAMLGIATAHVSCDRWDDHVWAELPHAISPSGWCVAYIQTARESSPSAHSTVLLDLDRGTCCAIAVEFPDASVPLKMRWLDANTLEIRYPKEASPVWPCDDAAENVVECVGRSVRVVLLRI